MDGVASAAMSSDKVALGFDDGADEKGRHRRTAFWRGKSVTVAFFSDKVRWWECEGCSYGAGEWLRPPTVWSFVQYHETMAAFSCDEERAYYELGFLLTNTLKQKRLVHELVWLRSESAKIPCAPHFMSRCRFILGPDPPGAPVAGSL